MSGTLVSDLGQMHYAVTPLLSVSASLFFQMTPRSNIKLPFLCRDTPLPNNFKKRDKFLPFNLFLTFSF